MTSRKKKSDDSTPTDMFTLAIEAQQRMAAMALHFNATVLSETAALNSEVMDFVQRRIGEDLDTASELGRCESFDQAMETLTRFQQKALEDYTDETARLSALNTHVSDALIAEVAEDAETVVEGVLRRAA